MRRHFSRLWVASLAFAGTSVGCGEIVPIKTYLIDPPALEGAWLGNGRGTGDNLWSGDTVGLIQVENAAISGALRTPEPFEAPIPVLRGGHTRHMINGRHIVEETIFGVDKGFDPYRGYFLIQSRELLKSGNGFIERYLYLDVEANEPAHTSLTGLVERLDGTPIGEFVMQERNAGQGFPSAPYSAERFLHEPWLEEDALSQFDYAVDRRFYGWYYGSGATVTADVPYSDGKYRTETVTLEQFSLGFQHGDPDQLPFAGVIYGDGYARTSDQRTFRITVSGEVLRRGDARITASIPYGFSEEINGRNVHSAFSAGGRALLSNDGVELTLLFLGNTLKLRKDGLIGGQRNTPPNVTITSPLDGELFDPGEEIDFQATVSDAVDSPADLVYLRWTDERGDVFGNSVPNGSGFEPRTSVTWSKFQAGEHEITFEATDSGGLRSTATVKFKIRGQPPAKPKIILPIGMAQVNAGSPVLFRGTGYDPEDGFTGFDSNGDPTGPDLSWQVFGPGAGSTQLATTAEGPQFTWSPPDAGEYKMVLTATDSDGQSNSIMRRMQASAASPNGSPPTVQLINPDPAASINGSATVVRGDPWVFEAQGSDPEDPPSSLTYEWRLFEVGANAQQLQTHRGRRWNYTFPASSAGIKTFRLNVECTDSSGMKAITGMPLIVFPEDYVIK